MHLLSQETNLFDFCIDGITSYAYTCPGNNYLFHKKNHFFQWIEITLLIMFYVSMELLFLRLLLMRLFP